VKCNEPQIWPGALAADRKDTVFAARNIEQVIIAGAFGSYIGVSSAVTIGVLSPCQKEDME